MFHKIKKIEPLKRQILKVYFENKKIKYYDMNKAINEIKELEPLKDENIFNKALVDVGGYGIIWNDEMDISSEEIYINGVDNIRELEDKSKYV